MIAFHDSHNIKYRNPFGAVKCGDTIDIGISIEGNRNPDSVYIVLQNEGVSIARIDMHNDPTIDKKLYRAQVKASDYPCLMWYYFEVHENNKIIYYGNNKKGLGGVGMTYHSSPKPFQITVFPLDYHTPEWLKGATVYQIFVDRFCNGNTDGRINNPKPNSFIYSKWDSTPMYILNGEKIARWEFFGGNLLGIIKKLDYIKELGVDAIYLNPIFESRSNHKYDTGNYMKIDPMFGDNTLFQDLCSKAEEKGIAIILDGVFSHTGADSIYFNRYKTYDSIGAFQGTDSPYYSWYRFNQYPDQYECWWGVDDLPNVNELEPSYMNFIIHDHDSVINYWMDMGCKGWRLDVADELPDEFIEQFRAAVKHKNPESALIGEVWEDASNKISYGKRRRYLYGGLLDSTTNYPFRKAIIDFIMENCTAEDFNAVIMSLYENYPRESFYSMLNMIGGHDVPRVLSIFSGEKEGVINDSANGKFEIAIKRMKLAVLLQMTLPGSPCIYYADEAGVFGFEEPKNRGTYPWGKENKELIKWYKTVTGMRNRYYSLKTGCWKTILTNNRLFGFMRYVKDNRDEFSNTAENEIIIIVVNTGMEEAKGIELTLPDFDIKILKDVFGGREITVCNGEVTVNIAGLEFGVYTA